MVRSTLISASLLRMAAVEELVGVDVLGRHARRADDLLSGIDHRRRPAHVDVMLADPSAELHPHVLAHESARARPVRLVGLSGEHRDELELASPRTAHSLDVVEAIEVLSAPRAEVVDDVALHAVGQRLLEHCLHRRHAAAAGDRQDRRGCGSEPEVAVRAVALETLADARLVMEPGRESAARDEPNMKAHHAHGPGSRRAGEGGASRLANLVRDDSGDEYLAVLPRAIDDWLVDRHLELEDIVSEWREPGDRTASLDDRDALVLRRRVRYLELDVGAGEALAGQDEVRRKLFGRKRVRLVRQLVDLARDEPALARAARANAAAVREGHPLAERPFQDRRFAGHLELCAERRHRHLVRGRTAAKQALEHAHRSTSLISRELASRGPRRIAGGARRIPHVRSESASGRRRAGPVESAPIRRRPSPSKLRPLPTAERSIRVGTALEKLECRAIGVKRGKRSWTFYDTTSASLPSWSASVGSLRGAAGRGSASPSCRCLRSSTRCSGMTSARATCE